MATAEMADVLAGRVLVIFIDNERHALIPYLNEAQVGRAYKGISYCRKTFIVQTGKVQLAYPGAIECATCRTRAAKQQLAL